MVETSFIIKPKPESQPIILLDVDYERYYEDGEELAKLVIYGRRKSGERIKYEVYGVLPYFYIDLTREQLSEFIVNQPIVNKWLLKYTEVNKIVYDGGRKKKLLKITGKQPWKVPQIRSIFERYQIQHYEADIPFTHRFMIDFNLKGLQKLYLPEMRSEEILFSPKVCSIDIEIDSDNIGSFESLIQEANRRITAIGISWNTQRTASGHKEDNLQEKVFLLKEDNDQAEIGMLRQCFRFLWNKVDPDIICTYNGDNFDLPYINNRFRVLSLDPGIFSNYNNPLQEPRFGNGWQSAGVIIYDLYKQTKWLYTDDGRKTLDSVAKELLGVSKMQIDQTHSELWRSSMDNPSTETDFIDYVARDALLTRKLWDTMNMEQWLEVIKISGGPPGDAMYFTERQAGEFLVFQTMFEQNILIPSAPSAMEKKNRKKERKSAMGGYVFDPIRDIATSVLICDFASMYPTIIIAHNIGGESFNPKPATLDARFDDKLTTSMKLMQEDLLQKRYEVKDQLKSADADEIERLKAYSGGLKIVANSTFGAYNFIGSRFYNTELAGTITGLGRNYLQTIAKQVQNYNPAYETIYGDTDSVFIETDLDEQVAKIFSDEVSYTDSLEDIINKLLDYLHEFLPDQMNLELEDIAYRILFHKGAKKRYAYVSALDKSINIMGFEAIRNDFSPFAKRIQEFAFDLLLRSGDLVKTKKQTITYIQQLLQLPEDELKDLVITLGPLKRDPKEYKSMTPAVASYLHYKYRNDDVDTWKNIDFFPFIITKGTSAQKDRARHPDLVEFYQIDIDHYIEEGLRSINRFNLGITLDEAKGIRNHELDDFFEPRTV